MPILFSATLLEVVVLFYTSLLFSFVLLLLPPPIKNGSVFVFFDVELLFLTVVNIFN